MDEIYGLLADAVHVIREDSGLRETFNKILGAGLGPQRVPLLLRELEAQQAPQKILDFVRLLNDDRVAELVSIEINR